MRRLAVVLAAIAATLALAIPAQADIPGTSYTQVGFKTGVFRNPNNTAQYIRWRVATNLGNIDADAAKEVVVGTASMNEEHISTGGSGVARFHIKLLRTRQGHRVVNDYFPSAGFAGSSQGGPLNNTRCRLGPTLIGDDAVLSLYDDRTPATPCSGPADALKNPLHNVIDYDPDANLIRGFTDQLPTSTQDCPNVGTRLVAEVRFDDGTLRAFEVVSGFASSNSPGCP